ncbi:hypothetical protein [Vogesella sp. LIG4]|uniref:hypothetical protein n=1 Tax=Vogesella sp. LIG4 TaxID=1192162 RepID=UPI00081FF33E|nr:hypothetical protein [Vogesella sp. LIG4]SCK29536.1 hypothetical protein PSELUDRAFT_3641 [Vogesella sp. LIG4]
MDLSQFAYLPFMVSLIVTVVVARKINYPWLFFCVALLSAFGIDHFSTLVSDIINAVIFPRMNESYPSLTDAAEYRTRYNHIMIFTYLAAELLVIPFMLWKLSLVFRKNT